MDDAMDPNNNADDECLDDPVVVGENGVVLHRNCWVMIRDGIVEKVAHVYNGLVHPFKIDEPHYVGQNDGSRMTVPMEGVAVIPGRAGMVAPGMLVDTKGNFTPTEGRTGRLHPSEPAYLGGPAPAVGDTMQARRDPDDVLKASQERTEEHQKALDEHAERMKSDEPHAAEEHAAIDQQVIEHDAASEHDLHDAREEHEVHVAAHVERHADPEHVPEDSHAKSD